MQPGFDHAMPVKAGDQVDLRNHSDHMAGGIEHRDMGVAVSSRT
jgi:hypothetical protein